MQKFSYFKTIDKIYRKSHPKDERFTKLRLDKNERLKNFPVNFLKKFKKKIETRSFAMYPELNRSYKLLARHVNVKVENLVITSGSDLAIKNCFELLVRKNSEVITISPTYGMVDAYCKLFQAKQNKINYKKDLKISAIDILSKINYKTNLVIIANPNSPTGTILKPADIVKIIIKAKKYNAYVLIDECYHGYYSKTCVNLINKYKNLIVSRSFSKIGLAGCRIGYLISSKKNIERLLKYRPMYEISHISSLFMNYCIQNYKVINSYFKDIEVSKNYFSKELKKLNLIVPTSYTNFQLVDFKNEIIKKKIFKKIKNKKINITEEKSLSKNHYLRFTLSTKESMLKPIKIIKQSLNVK